LVIGDWSVNGVAAMEQRMIDERKYRLDDFELYKRSRDFRRQMYKLANELPPKERYCLNPQMRKAALSTSNNVAEGHGRWHYQENIRFCLIARGSVEELLDDLNACLDEKYFPPDRLSQLKEDAYELIAKINGYIAYLRRTKQGKTD
jgi:four helix bundle protein